MTDCNTDPILFSSLGRRNVEARFNGGAITSDAGALLLRESMIGNLICLGSRVRTAWGHGLGLKM